VHGLIRGSAVTQDGRSNGMTAPNKQAQIAVLRNALANAGLRPDDIDFVEAQGTGSALGDAIEFGALLEVFGERGADHPMLIGAVKSNIGHLIASSGLASLIKGLLAIKHGEVPANLHLASPNPVVTLDGPVRPVQSRQPFRAAPQAPRRAGVSAFGWSGTNAHVIVEQAPVPEPDSEPAPEWQLLTLSAASEWSLRASAAALADHLESTEDSLADVAYTVQTGRAALRLRRALVCRDRADAVAKLREPLTDVTETPKGKPTVGVVLSGDVDHDSVADQLRAWGVPVIAVAASAEELAARVDVVVTLEPQPGRAEWLTAMGRLWEQGVPVDWAAGHGRRGRVVDLPTYPFQRTRFWPRLPEGSKLADIAAVVASPEDAQRYPRPDLRTPFLAPRTPTERRVAEVWQEGLGIEAIGVHDPFFELGGTSVIGVTVVNRLAKEFGVELTAASLFERPTVAQFAELLAGTEEPNLDAQTDRGSRRRAIAGAAARARKRAS
jgi:acyl transferase domain-containing protein